MRFFVLINLFLSLPLMAQNYSSKSLGFKGEHFVIYNKCKVAVTFCENTQQDYTYCGASKNCTGLYVLPGDTFYLNIADKTNSKKVLSDVLFDSYFLPITNHIFLPDSECYPINPILISIPLTAISNSSFQITAQNLSYNPPETFSPMTPVPMSVFIGGAQPVNSLALANFTTCVMPEPTDTMDVSVNEIVNSQNTLFIYPNPTKETIHLITNSVVQLIEIYDVAGELIYHEENPSNTISISNLDNGIYYVFTKHTNNQLQNQKLVVIK